PGALEFARRLMQKGLRPSVLRIYDGLETSLTIQSELLRPGGDDAKVALVVVFEGPASLAAAESEEALILARDLGVKDLGPGLAEHWWEHRYNVSYKQQLI